jgi:hypothetical protein
MTHHDWLKSLRFGERYHKPHNMTWHDLEHVIESDRTEFERANNRYWRHFSGYRLHRLRGDMFCLKCKCCGSTTDL